MDRAQQRERFDSVPFAWQSEGSAGGQSLAPASLRCGCSIAMLPSTDSTTPAVVSKLHVNFSMKNEITSATIGTITPM